MHMEGGTLPQAAEKTDPLPRLRSGTYHGFDDVTKTAYAWDGDRNLLKPVAGKSDRTYAICI